MKRRLATLSCLLLGLSACDGMAGGTEPQADAEIDGSAMSCRIDMADELNQLVTTLEARAIGPARWLVTDRRVGSPPMEVTVHVEDRGQDISQVVADVGVPAVTVTELLERYVLTSNEQLVFTHWPAFPCTRFEQSLIYFLVMEWFYFG